MRWFLKECVQLRGTGKGWSKEDKIDKDLRMGNRKQSGHKHVCNESSKLCASFSMWDVPMMSRASDSTTSWRDGWKVEPWPIEESGIPLSYRQRLGTDGS